MAPISIYIGVRREIRTVQIIFLIYSTIPMLYVIYSCLTMWILDPGFRPQITEIMETKIIITIFCIVFVILRMTMIISGIVMIFHFGTGLKEKVYGKDGIFYQYWRPKDLQTYNSAQHLLKVNELITDTVDEEIDQSLDKE